MTKTKKMIRRAVWPNYKQNSRNRIVWLLKLTKNIPKTLPRVIHSFHPLKSKTSKIVHIYFVQHKPKRNNANVPMELKLSRNEIILKSNSAKALNFPLILILINLIF